MSTCSNQQQVIDDLQQRIAHLSSRMASHERMVTQFKEERDRLQCVLDNLQVDDDDDSSDDSSDDDAVETPTNYVIVNTPSSISVDGPFK